MFRAFAFVVILGALSITVEAEPCPGAKNSTIGKNPRMKVVELPGRLFFGVRELALDFDGSPHAYGARDQGQENICAGLAPIAPPCRGKFRGPCYKVCQTTFASWSRSGGDPANLGKTMCSVGLGGAECSLPHVRFQRAPYQSYFVSETSLKVSPTSHLTAKFWQQEQAAQLNPAAIRYLVVPSALIKQGISFGDVGIAMDARSRTSVPFIVGDGGGLGEGSVSLLADLRPTNPPQLQAGVSALGERVMRYKQGLTGDFRFVIFPHTASLVPGTRNVATQTSVELPAWIKSLALATFAKRTNEAEVLRCAP